MAIMNIEINQRLLSVSEDIIKAKLILFYRAFLFLNKLSYNIFNSLCRNSILVLQSNIYNPLV